MAPPPAGAATGDISTLAGGGTGEGIPAVVARLAAGTGGVSSVAVAGNGDIFVADSSAHRVRHVDHATGIIATVVGNGSSGFSGDGGAASAARVSGPQDVALDRYGNLFIADSNNARVRRVEHATGIITTVAGNGSYSNDGTDGDGAPALAASVAPSRLALDGAGNLFLLHANQRVRKVDVTGLITAVAGSPGPGGFAGDGGPATAARLNEPSGMAADAAGNLLIADPRNHRVRKVDLSGTITTFAGTGIGFFNSDGIPATTAGLRLPGDVAVDSTGNVLIADSDNYRIRSVDPTGTITTVAGIPTTGPPGDGGPATSAMLDVPSSVNADGANNVFLGDGKGVEFRVRRVGHETRIITTVAGGGQGDGLPGTEAILDGPYGLTFAGGNLYVSENTHHRIGGGVPNSGDLVRKIDAVGVITTVAGGAKSAGSSHGDGGPARSAFLGGPKGMAVDGEGNLLIADCGTNKVRKVAASGIITTIAGGGPYREDLGDGGPAARAILGCPSDVFVATGESGPAAGTLFIADTGNHRVRKVDTSGVITTVAGTGTAGFGGDGGPAVGAGLNSPQAVTIDTAGDLLIADSANNRIRRVGADGVISTIAGNGGIGFGSDGVAAITSNVVQPTGLAIEPDGDVIIAESKFARVRRVSMAGIITTVAGTGIPGFAGDGGPATRAQVSSPTDVAVDPAGYIYVTDHSNERVRRIEPAGDPPAPPAGGCGQVITADTVLHEDIGPCPADGIIVGADNITLDLNGHQVLGDPGAPGTRLGIVLTTRTGVRVTGGTVSGFEAGVAVFGGSRNTITRMVVRDNVASVDSYFGDGILLLSSKGNRINNSIIDHSGTYDGIGILGVGSDDNVIESNVIRRTVNGGFTDAAGIGILINPFFSPDLTRDLSIFRNRVVNNLVTDNESAGISSISNIDGVISGNVVTRNGLATPGSPGNGIGVSFLMLTDPRTNVSVTENEVHGNGNNGIDVGSEHNRIADNDSSDNHANPAFVAGHDLVDRHPGCDANVWSDNLWGGAGFSPACTTAGGHSVHGTADIAVFRPATGAWLFLDGPPAVWGAGGDVPALADYDGDGQRDIAVFRPSLGGWYVQSGATAHWGTEGDIAVPADYTGDGKADPAVFRPSTGAWYVRGAPVTMWGSAGDVPVPGDYDGDGDREPAVFRPSTGTWFVKDGPTLRWGTAGDIPVAADYDGDGRTDPAVFRPSSGAWFVPSGGQMVWGTAGDIPVAGDYDGDGRAEMAVFRPATGTWFVHDRAPVQLGAGGDIPLPGAN